jgi:hypothetical protein
MDCCVWSWPPIVTDRRLVAFPPLDRRTARSTSNGSPLRRPHTLWARGVREPRGAHKRARRWRGFGRGLGPIQSWGSDVGASAGRAEAPTPPLPPAEAPRQLAPQPLSRPLPAADPSLDARGAAVLVHDLRLCQPVARLGRGKGDGRTTRRHTVVRGSMLGTLSGYLFIGSTRYTPKPTSCALQPGAGFSQKTHRHVAVGEPSDCQITCMRSGGGGAWVKPDGTPTFIAHSSAVTREVFPAPLLSALSSSSLRPVTATSPRDASG